MHFHIITLFPQSLDSYLEESILSRAIEDKKIKVSTYNPRDFTKDKNSRVDKPPYGGGPGMVLQAEPVARAIEKAIKAASRKKKSSIKIIFLSPSGKQFDNTYATKIAKKYTDIVIISGRYEGIDARVRKMFKMEEVSIGPFVLTGGELPALIMVDVISRQVEGVLGNSDSIEERRVASKDVYTRPEILVYKNKKYKVPKILLSGNRKAIDEWKQKRK
jgi:tRNA (guanine37-N1)-methyltransferase